MLASSFDASRRALALSLIVLVGCGDPLVTIDDAGEPGEDASPGVDASADTGVDAGVDGGRDLDPPRVTSTRPRGGEDLVTGSRELEIRFSEAMDESDGAGTVSASTGGAAIALGTATWNAEGDVLLVAPSTSWPSGSRIDVHVEGFRDLAGNALAEDHDFVFHTSDQGPPSVVESTPAEGATNVDPTTGEIVVRFSEPMNPYVGTVALSGGEGVLGAQGWSSPTELRVALSGLLPSAAYSLALTGFEDVGGNALDGAPVLGDGAIDFTTVPDETVPTLVDSNPTNGQLDIDIAVLRTITLQFSEPMDTSVRTAVLDDGTAVETLTGNWTDGATRLTFSVSGRLAIAATHELDLGGLRDRAGNALDGTVLLDAGVLSFTTSAADDLVPFVVFTTPVEGGTDVPTRTTLIEVLFSEAMSTATTSFPLLVGTAASTVTGTWNAAGTRLSFALDAGLAALTDHMLDLRATEDLSGNALDAAHPYLADGVLGFRTGAPTGEDCADPLTTGQATSAGGAFVWELAPRTFVSEDRTLSCSPTGVFHDGVIEYTKATGDVASGGRALRITALSTDLFNDVQLEVLAGACDPDGTGAGTTGREICLGARRQWVQYLDVPAGTYYLWLATESSYSCSGTTCSGHFGGATITIEEVAALPHGESCSDPYTTASAIHSSPATDEHRWLVAGDSASSVDYGSATNGDGALSCAAEQGPDAVIRIEKTRASSILDIVVDPFPAETDRDGVDLEIRTSCDGATGAAAALQCRDRLRGVRDLQVAAGAGPLWLWLAAHSRGVPLQRTEVVVREVDPGLGETCATAIPIAPSSSVAITPNGTERFFAPSCIAAGDVTWYRYTTTRELNLVGSVGAGPIAIVDPATGAELGCEDDNTRFGLPRRAPVGSEVCIAVPSGSPITALTIQELDWQGVGGVPTDLQITPPVDGSGNPISITTEAWLAVTPTQLYMGVNPNSTSTTVGSALIVAPRIGMNAATRVPVDRYALGNAGAALGEALFSVDETNATARLQRLFRLVGPDGSIAAPAGTAWDPGSLYQPKDIDAMALIGGTTTLIMASEGSRTSATATPPLVVTPTYFYTASTDGAEPVARIGDNPHLRDAVAVAANGSWVFIMATSDVSGGAIYRVSRADLTSTPEVIAPSAQVSLPTSNGSMAYDIDRDILYFRASTPAGVHAIFGASTATPIYAGPVLLRGRSGDHGLALDPAIPALFMFETETVTTGAFVELR